MALAQQAGRTFDAPALARLAANNDGVAATSLREIVSAGAGPAQLSLISGTKPIGSVCLSAVAPSALHGRRSSTTSRGSAGPTCSGTSPPTATGWPSRKQFGSVGLQIARDLFKIWDAYQADGDRARLQAQTAPLQDKLRQLLEHAAGKSARTKYHRQFAKNLLNRWPALWTFIHSDGVEPTNNHAEGGLCGAVIYRKHSLGSQSDQGERTIERLLSASVTCRLRKRSLFDYLTEAITAHARGDTVPGLA